MNPDSWINRREFLSWSWNEIEYTVGIRDVHATILELMGLTKKKSALNMLDKFESLQIFLFGI